MQDYLLSLSSLLAVMQGISGTHWFHTELSARIGKDTPIAEIMIHDGKLIMCQVRTGQGSVLLRKDQAVSMIEEMGELNWSLVAPPQRSIQTHLEPSRERIPVRLIVGILPTALPHRHKHVLSLMDGQRTVEHIARLLHLSSQEIQTILQDLQQGKLITFEERIKDDSDSQ